jgi:protein-S-isoprenylcysteine O-methyltransferase Ste14
VILSLLVSNVPYLASTAVHKYELMAGVLAALALLYGMLQCWSTLRRGNSAEARRRRRRLARHQAALLVN